MKKRMTIALPVLIISWLNWLATKEGKSRNELLEELLRESNKVLCDAKEGVHPLLIKSLEFLPEVVS